MHVVHGMNARIASNLVSKACIQAERLDAARVPRKGVSQ